MGSEVVVDVAPNEVEDSGLEDRVEDLAVEELVAERGVEALHERVLPGAAGLDVDGAGAGEPTPITNCSGYQFRPVVHADALGCTALGLGLSSTSTTSAAVMERPSWRPVFSRVCSSHMARALIGRPSAVATAVAIQTGLAAGYRQSMAAAALVAGLLAIMSLIVVPSVRATGGGRMGMHGGVRHKVEEEIGPA